MDGTTSGEKPRLVAFESRTMRGETSVRWPEVELKLLQHSPLEELPELPTGQEYWLNEKGEVIGKRMTAEESDRRMAESRRRLRSEKPNERTEVKKKKAKQVGRKPAKMTAEEKRIWDRWQTGRYKTHSDLDGELKVAWGTVEKTLDRLRARKRRDRQTTKRTK